MGPTLSPPVKPGFLSRVESVRGLAALSVAFGHTLNYVLVNDGSGGGLLDQTSLRGAAVKFITGLFNGETAVIVFFVISGVVIGRSLDARRGGESAVAGLMPFMIRRVLRLYPAHIVAVLGIIGLAFLFLVGQPPIDFSAFPGSYPATSADSNPSRHGLIAAAGRSHSCSRARYFA